MQSFDYTIKDALGIHARPAGSLAKEVKNFQSAITIAANGKSVPADKMMKIRSRGVKQGVTVTISADGADEADAINALKAFMEANL